ncbi:MAG TPA: DUF4402 domain-containing protein [Chlorobium sp.]|uniref:DUF4402 domain-containing protein n=1 Tax=Chlorobium phaeovibrioides (strain DSM 265 / 1930) TaxID=290318 RepID=A4SEJ3_CHLPM|nr:DUF4402 domain-containing protein [Chlorobium sp.]
MKQKKLLAVAALLSMSAFGFSDAHAIEANATAQIRNDISITTVETALNFGVVIPGTTDGTVVVAAASSVGVEPTFTGTSVSMANYSACSPGHFAVRGDGSANYVITVPETAATLSHSVVSGKTMTVDTWTSSKGSQPVLDADGTDAFSVGGTLHLAAGQLSGTYNGQYAVTVAYGNI